MELPTRQELDQLAQELWKKRYALPTRRQATEQELECVLWLAPDLLAREGSGSESQERLRISPGMRWSNAWSGKRSSHAH